MAWSVRSLILIKLVITALIYKWSKSLKKWFKTRGFKDSPSCSQIALTSFVAWQIVGSQLVKYPEFKNLGNWIVRVSNQEVIPSISLFRIHKEVHAYWPNLLNQESNCEPPRSQRSRVAIEHNGKKNPVWKEEKLSWSLKIYIFFIFYSQVAFKAKKNIFAALWKFFFFSLNQFEILLYVFEV